MKKESRASKITSVFDNLDIDKLSSVASKMSTPSVSEPVQALVEVEIAPENTKKDRRFTIILPHDLYMKMVLKTKSEGISFTKYIHAIMEKDLS